MAQTLLDTELNNVLSNSPYAALESVQNAIKVARNNKDIQYQKYVKIMTERFNSNKHQKHYNRGDTVAYYVGDEASNNKKLQRRFTGPWKVLGALPQRNNVYYIENPENGDKLACHVKHLKKYYPAKFVPLIDKLRAERQTMHDASKINHK